jgi:hypothetical protein
MRITNDQGYALVITNNGTHVVSYVRSPLIRDSIRFDVDGASGAWWDVTRYHRKLDVHYHLDDDGQEMHYVVRVLAVADTKDALPSPVSLGIPREVPQLLVGESVDEALKPVVELIDRRERDPAELVAARSVISHYPCIYQDYVRLQSVSEAQKAVVAYLFD